MNLSLLKTYYKFLMFAVLFLLSSSSWSQTFNQINTIGALTDGQYLLVGDGTTNDGIMLNTITVATPFINFTSVTNPGATINSGTTTANEFQVTVTDGVITIYNTSAGYVSWGRTGNTNNTATFYNDTPGNNERWTATVNSGLWTLSNVATPARSLQWNNSSPRFACYTGTQVRIKLYKKEVAVVAPTVTGGTVNGTVATALTNYQIVATNSPTAYAVSSGTLPAGLSLNLTSGIISGTPTTAGSSSVQVTATNATGTSDPATLNFEIATANQTITFAALVNRQYGDANFNLTGTASSGLTVQYESSNTAVATVSGNTVTIVGVGSTNITASQPGNSNYNAATNVVRSLTITPRQLTISGLTGNSKINDALTATTATGTAVLDNVLPADIGNVTLSGTPSFNFVTATVGTNKNITVTGYTLSGSAAGNYTVTQPSLTANVTVKTITVSGANASNKTYDGTTTATIVGGTLNGVETTDIANVNFNSTGAFDTAIVGDNKAITVSISGSAAFNYNLTQPGITASITKANQTITFNALPTLTTNSADLNLNTYASTTSGLAITYESSNPTVVSVSGNTLTVVGAGTATITASQDGDVNFNPAVDATQNVTVNIAPSVLAGWDFQTTTNGGTALLTAPSTPKQITANFGSGVLYLDGTNSSSNFIGSTTGNELNSFAGTAENTSGTGFSTTTTGAAALALIGGTSTSANGKSAVFLVDMTNYANLTISYAAQRTATGFNSNNWEYSTDGSTWNPIATITTIPSSFGLISLPSITGLDNASTAYVRLTISGATNATGNNRLDNIKFEASIIPITEVTWNGTEWSNNDGPDDTIDAIIDGIYETGTDGAFTAKKLTVTSGSLTINSGTSITVEDVLENELTSADVVVENNANLIQSNDVDNIGAITVERNSNPLMRLDYTLWSSPVAEQNLLDFSPETVTNRFYTYNSGTDAYNAVIPSTTDFAEGIGYLIRMPDDHPTTPTIWTGSYDGVPNNGDVTLSVTNGQYVAIGNPYPSTIDADLFIGENDITEPLYFWRKTNNAATTSYATYTLAGGAGTSENDGDPLSLTPNGIIQVGQGFIVQAASSQLVFTNQMRVGNIDNQFFRSSVEKSRIWLNMTNASGVFSQTMIAYMEGSSLELDPALDGKFFNDSQTALTSLIGTDEYAVQARGNFVATDVVPLNFKTQQAGTYSIAIGNVDGLFTTNENIYLKDNVMGIEHDLRNSAYDFTSEAGVFANRFEIVYQETLSVNLPVFENGVLVYSKENTIHINSGIQNMETIRIFDIRGSLIAEQSNVNATSTSVSLAHIQNQVLIVQVIGENGQTATKKIVH